MIKDIKFIWHLPGSGLSVLHKNIKPTMIVDYFSASNICRALLLLLNIQFAQIADAETNSSASEIEDLFVITALADPRQQQRSETEIRKILLGEKLFHDPILSYNQSLSCSSCHILDDGGDDNRQYSLTTEGVPREINTPTVFNAALNPVFTWTGKHESLPAFIGGPLFAERVMNHEWNILLPILKSNTEYQRLFGEIYELPVTQLMVVETLQAFQETLITPNSRFDQYLRGDTSAINDREKHGYALFQSYGCIACHQGRNIGGNMFQKFGLYGDYYESRGRTPQAVDFGRFTVTGDELDRFTFRVPSLRNVATTAPYLHDGSVETLEEVIQVMVRFQLGRNINKTDRVYLREFLETLTGNYQPLKAHD